MEYLIRQIAQDHLWNQWVAANSAGDPTLDTGCISRKDGCISRKAGCISRKAGCISRKAGCISRKAGCIS
ncbi:hypothetical protein WMF31_02385 [Sorangium sp. So ce1036]|uniref:hypothetical protein n=1 Tax=Sorangium sp. So ce1036 TaxID=3133328 RepID=UPI003F06DF3E